MQIIRNTHIRSIKPLITATQLLQDLPATEQMYNHIARSRAEFCDCLHGRDNRLVVVMSFCSAHDPIACLEYAKRAKILQSKLKNTIIFLREYFEKPRSGPDWEGYLIDPKLDGSCDIQSGIIGARMLLLEIAKLEMSVATEFVDPNFVNYLADLVGWGCIGARTAESPLHARLGSGLSLPIGAKNTTSGDITPSINSMQKISAPRNFVGPDDDGQLSLIETTGNPDVHLVLRGGSSGPNYQAECVAKASAQLEEAGLPGRVAVDCSHANSAKDYRRQHLVVEDIARQRTAGNSPIFCAMLESALVEGKQPIGPLETLTYGQSITDGCIGWDETEELVFMLDEA